MKMGYDNLKLEKGMYRQEGMSFTQVLESLDPSENSLLALWSYCRFRGTLATLFYWFHHKSYNNRNDRMHMQKQIGILFLCIRR